MNRISSGQLPPIEEVRARQLVHQAGADCRAIARTITLANAAGMDSETLLAMRQLLNQATNKRDGLQSDLHRLRLRLRVVSS